MLKTKNKVLAKYAALSECDERLMNWMEQADNGTSLSNLTSNQRQDMWSCILKAVQDPANDSSAAIDDTIAVLNNAFKCNPSHVTSSHTCLQILKTLNEKLRSSQDQKAICALVKFNEAWIANEDLPEIEGMIEFTFLSFLNLVASVPKPSSADLKRLYNFRQHVPISLMGKYQSVLNKIVQNTSIIVTDIGQKIVSYILSLSDTIFKSVYKVLALELSNCSKSVAIAYGKSLMTAWHNASDDLKTIIKSRFQSLMEEFIKLKRTSLELSKRSSNVFVLINVWNIRKKGKDDFLSMITECYQPILWKYLQNGLNYQRCNAADLFMKAFPLHVVGDGAAEVALFNIQVQHMADALVDDCHIVRIIAVREILNILSVYWSEFSSVQIHSLMTTITKSNAADTSSAEVRRTVWRGLTSFVTSDSAFAYLRQILPSLGRYFRDVNQSVRIAFIRLLIAIRERKDPVFRVSSVVDAASLLQALMHENQTVGRWLVALLLPTFYKPEMEPSHFIQKFCNLIKKFPHAYRNFFMYSKRVLSFESALNIMCELIIHLGAFVQKKLRDGDENEYEEDEDEDEDMENDSTAANHARKRGRSKMSKKRSRNSSRNSSASARDAPCAFEDLEVVVGMFDIICILWALHSEELNLPENKAQLQKLCTNYLTYAMPFISYYKGTPIFTSVVSLSGNIQKNLLTANSITLPGYCIKKMKTMRLDEKWKDDEDGVDGRTMLVALVQWSCGSQILDYVALSLEEAFQAAEIEVGREKKKVKITEVIANDPMQAIELVNIVLRTGHTKSKIITKHYAQLLELYKLMEQTRALLFRRFLRGRQYSDSRLSDEFLLLCFRRHVKLIPHLHKTESPDEFTVDGESEETFDAEVELAALIGWVRGDLLPLLQSDEAELPDLRMIAQVINDSLCIADNMITVGLVGGHLYDKVGELAMSLITGGYNLHFVNGVSRVAAALCYGALARGGPERKDDLQIWSIQVPALFVHSLNAIVASSLAPDTLQEFAEDFCATKTNISKILAVYQNNFDVLKKKETLRSVQILVNKMLQAVRSVLFREIPRSDMSIPVYSTLASLPSPAATVLAPLFNKQFWTPMFLLTLKQELSCSVKTLLIDIIIIHLFGKIGNNKWLLPLTAAYEAANAKLIELKCRRSTGQVRSLRLTLTHVEGPEEDRSNDDDLDEEMETESSEPTETQTMPSDLRGSNGRQTIESRDSAPSNMATVDTESRCSQPTMPTSQSTLPTLMEVQSSQPEPEGCSQGQDMCLGLISSQHTQLPSSQVATQGSQPMSSQTSTDPSADQPALNKTFSPRSDDVGAVPEADLIDDFISCGEELLKSVKTSMTKRSDASNS